MLRRLFHLPRNWVGRVFVILYWWPLAAIVWLVWLMFALIALLVWPFFLRRIRW